MNRSSKPFLERYFATSPLSLYPVPPRAYDFKHEGQAFLPYQLLVGGQFVQRFSRCEGEFHPNGAAGGDS